jgi:hypothetical protein
VAQHALERRFFAGRGQDREQAAADASPEERWPVRRRFMFIAIAAALCWAVPALLAYWLIAG